MSGIWSRGYNGDCRDCVYYSNNYNWVRKNEYYCSHSGETFTDEYGNQCHCFKDIDAFKQEEEERQRKKYENEVLFENLMLDSVFNNNENTEESNNQEKINGSSSDGGVILLTFLALILLLFLIGKSYPLLISIIFLTVIALIYTIFAPTYYGNIKTCLLKAFLFSIIIHFIYFLYNLIL